MKNKLLGILFCGILLLGLTGCKNERVDNKVSLTVKEGTLAPIGVTLILKNESNTDYSYGEPYYIEQEIDGNWSKVQTIHDVVFNLPAYGLESGKSVEFSINWAYGYGQLKSGKYRIVKEIFEKTDFELHDSNIVSFNVYAEFEINEDDYEYEKATTEEIELKTELKFKSSIDDNGQYINWEDGLVDYNVYIKNNKLYAKNLKTNEEKIVFDKEPVKNIAVRPICCAANGHLLILTSNGNVYMSDEDCNYFFTFNMKYTKLNAENIVSFKLVPLFDYDVAKNLYGIDSEGNEILLHRMN